MIVTLTGPSCAGKSTLEKMLVKLGFSNAISTTTRQPRASARAFARVTAASILLQVCVPCFRVS